MAAAQEISLDAAVAPVLSELHVIFTLKEEQACLMWPHPPTRSHELLLPDSTSVKIHQNGPLSM